MAKDLARSKTLPTDTNANATTKRSSPAGGIRMGTAALIFMGTFLGSLIGAAGDFGQFIGSIGDIQRFFAPPPTLCVAGSQTILELGVHLGTDWKAGFELTHDVNVQIDATGSITGIQNAAAGGCAHVLAMSEAMTLTQQDSLKAAGITLDCAAQVGYDILTFVTNINNSSATVTLSQLTRILTGQITNWSEVGGPNQVIYIMVRPGSGTTDFVLQGIARFTPTPQAPYPSAGQYVECGSHADCMNKVLSTPGSLFWASTSWILTQPPQFLKIVSIIEGDEAFHNPLQDNFDITQYPARLVRPLYLYSLYAPNMQDDVRTLARDFIAFARGMSGQLALEQRHFYTYFNVPRDVAVPLPEGFGVPPSGGAPVVCR